MKEYSITAQFDEGDPVYDWIILFLTEKKIWKRSRRFHVTARSSRRRWGISMGQNGNANHHQSSSFTSAEYVPTYDMAQLFRWNSYWTETRRTLHEYRGGPVYSAPGDHAPGSRKLFLTIYTRSMSALSSFVDDARELYQEVSQPHVIVHTIEQNSPYLHGQIMGNPWLSIKNKARRPISSIILPNGIVQSLVDDAKEFLSMVDWYSTAAIPHRRGYLLHGPPGTGKTSTIYALAGELGLEIYSLSLASGHVDDSFLQRAVSSIPNTAILLIEDIDCAFTSREDEEEEELPAFPGMGVSRTTKSGVTLSGLLNVLDGVGSEEGKLFFATTNYIERLDPALLRPGRIDRKIQYKLSTKEQAEALFLRFYPPSYTLTASEASDSSITSTDSDKTEKSPTSVIIQVSDQETRLKTLASEFSLHFPEHEFSLAELQGYLLSCKKEPEIAVAELKTWVEEERKEKEERTARAEERKIKMKDKKDIKEAAKLQGSLQRLGILGNSSETPFVHVNGISAE
uniref:AAA+ ATPase domain-containing protein n=1 Tax=Psilocybe cubensis TaxID=181762 RepID=A0A8H7XJN9_PSICU